MKLGRMVKFEFDIVSENCLQQFVTLNLDDHMNKGKFTFLIISIIIFISVVIFFVINSLRPKLGGVYIESNPSASVWIDGKQVGRTPFRETYKPSDVVIRLVPDSFGEPLMPYETKVALVAGVETVVRYDFGENDDLSSGDIISFEKNSGSGVSLVAVSIPDSAQLTIDGLEKAFTPHKTSALTAGEHELKFSLKGYEDRKVMVKTHEGYKLTAVVKLAKSSEGEETEEQEPEDKPVQDVRERVEILSTPTGFLRVRKTASTLADEVGQVAPGERYPLVSVDEVTGWYEIELTPAGEGGVAAKTGWISNQYAKKVSSSLSGTPTPTPKTASPSAATKTPTPTRRLTPTP